MRQFNVIFGLIVLNLINHSQGRFVPIVQSKFESCGTKNSAGIFDIKQITFEMLDDTSVAINGSVLSNKLIISPWQIQLTSEKFDKGKWIEGELTRRIDDFCVGIKNSEEPWYFMTKNWKNFQCPIKPKSVETFNMMRITDFDMDLPSKFAGRWRMNINMIFPQTPPTIDCYRFYFDIEEI